MIPPHLSLQFSSVAQSCPTLCDPMNRSTPSLPVHHQLPEFTQTHIHWVRDAIQPSHPLSSPSQTESTTLMAEIEEKLKSLLMKVKKESGKPSLKLNIQKTKVMASGPITSWETDGETMETVTNVIFLGSKITADGDCSHEIKRHLLLGRKAVTNIDSILKSRVITLQTKSHLVRAWRERLKAGGKRDNRAWVGQMASLTRWTWIWASSRSWWWTDLAWCSSWIQKESDTTEGLN